MLLKPGTVIESARLIVRPVEQNDLPGLLPINGDDQVTRFLPYASWRSLADGRAWLERMKALGAMGASIQFVVVDRASGVPIGTCLLFRYEQASERAEIGYLLGREHWGRGLMREALTALITHAFSKWSLRRLEAEVDPLNGASARLLETLGFAREGLLRQRWNDKGNIHDSNIYGLLRDDWSAVNRVAVLSPSAAEKSPALAIQSLEAYLHGRIPLSAAMQVSVLAADAEHVVLSAPLAPNINHRDTVFGGSASAVAMLAAWSLLHTKLTASGLQTQLVIQRNAMEYERPITGAFTATASVAGAEAWGRFIAMLKRKGVARIEVTTVLAEAGRTAGKFAGEFVADL
jgi:[ribosomal protein S5]-alanine N-acetyltransferase